MSLMAVNTRIGSGIHSRLKASLSREVGAKKSMMAIQGPLVEASLL